MAAKTDLVPYEDPTRADPADRLAVAAPDADDAPMGSGLNAMAVVSRRWPLILVGVIGGLVFGFLYHLQRPPVFQSSCQVLVIKKRAETVGAGQNGMDARQQYVEDYVSTQVTLLKSERMLMVAGRKLNPQEVREPLPETDRERAWVIQGRLQVARDREPGAPAIAAGSGVLNLSFRAAHPETTKAMLKAVVEAYQDELGALYDEASKTRVLSIEKLMAVFRQNRNDYVAEQGRKRDDLRRITSEELINIRTRLSEQTNLQLDAEKKRIDLDRQLEAIREAGDDPQKQRATAELLGYISRKSVFADPSAANSTEVLLRKAGLERDELSLRLGRDHPQMKAMDRQIRSLRADLAGGAGMTEDDYNPLVPIRRRVLHEKATLDLQLGQTQAQIVKDLETITQAGKIQDEIKALDDRISDVDKTMREQEQARQVIEATASSGGFQARTITEPAAGGQIAPVLNQSLIFGAVLGALAGAGLGVLAELADQGFKSPADVRKRLGVPIIGHLPMLNPPSYMAESEHPNVDPNIVIVHKPKSTEAEAYRGVRTQLYFSTQGRGHQLIQLTSPNPGDGKSTLAANLAASIAQSGKKVVLVDCDFRKPRVHKMWNIVNPEVGMSTIVAGQATVEAAVQKSEVPNLDLLPCGPRPANPAELLTSPGYVDALNKLRAAYEFVIVDTPPMLAVSDPAVVAPRADGVILVLRMSKKARPAAVRARELLAAVGANVIGVAVNGIGGKSNEYGAYGGYGSYGGYGYGYSYNYQYRYQYQYEYEYADEYVDEPEETQAIDGPKHDKA